ncbi:MAG: cardiolipin synthase [Massiliimalia sp.]|jgi:cardiolipin synthase
MKKLIQFLFHRVVLVGLMIFVQILILVVAMVKFQHSFVYFYAICEFLSLMVVLYIINDKSNPGYKIAWIVPILLLPIFGGMFYLLFGGNKTGKYTRRKMDRMAQKIAEYRDINNDILDEIHADSPDAALQSAYIQNYAYSPPYHNASATYLPLGEIKFSYLLEELQKAQHFIFLEYFILEEGIMWNSILDILKEKVSQGVDVRVIYDDLGCAMTLPYQYHKKLRSYGIQCCVFNPFIPIMSARLNNRDHRKIVVIDGNTAFTGGINLADEYINAYEKHGHWKDSSLMIKGEAVWSFTVMFLSMWDYLNNVEEDFTKFAPTLPPPDETDGYIQPYTDNPLDHEPVGETVYLNLINRCKRYVYITTPYLIIDNEMMTALNNAAKSGIDVRIITPHIADKWFVHAVTRAYYEPLVESGVKIYEYTPGFIHAKTFVADDEYATVGSINLDYRSLYLHFECGAWLYHSKVVLDVKNDFEKTLTVCEEITLEKCRRIRWYRRFVRSILRAFAPLM